MSRDGAGASARCSPSRTTTARTRTCSSGPTSSAARPSCACACRADARRRGRAPLRPRRRAARRRGEIDEETETDDLVARAASRSGTRSTRYRWLLRAARSATRWVNGARHRRRTTSPDADDFVLIARPRPGPTGTSSSVVYEIFPDRFASSRRSTSTRPTGRSGAPGTSCRPDAGRRRRSSSTAATSAASSSTSTTSSARRERRLPDAVLPGRQHPPLRRDDASTTSTRCSAATRRSPRSTRAAHARGHARRRRPDLEPHAASGHEWFQAALADPGAPEREFFYFDDSLPARLRVVARASARCRSSTGARPSSRARLLGVVRRWLEPPYELDGWRDRRREHDRPLPRRRRQPPTSRRGARSASSRAARRAARRRARPRLPRRPRGRGWHGDMNYAGFLRPGLDVAARRRPPRTASHFWGIPVGAAAACAGDAGGRGDARLPRRRPLASVAPLLDAARQPRHRPLPHGRRLARAPARRRRAADDDARACRWSSPATSSGSRATGARTRAGRCRGTAPETWDATLLDDVPHG